MTHGVTGYTQEKQTLVSTSQTQVLYPYPQKLQDTQHSKASTGNKRKTFSLETSKGSPS